jgi:hypothetical protein
MRKNLGNLQNLVKDTSESFEKLYWPTMQMITTIMPFQMRVF